MTENKYRAYDIENKIYRSNTWLAEKYIIICFSGRLYQYYINEKGIASKDVSDKYILERCTALSDKTNMEIYEGDILNCNLFHAGLVVFSSNTLRWLAICSNYEYALYYVSNMEIIGNIHENPELLEVKE